MPQTPATAPQRLDSPALEEPSSLLCVGFGNDATPLKAQVSELAAAAGWLLQWGRNCSSLVQQVQDHAPAQVIAWAAAHELLPALAAWQGQAPCPVMWVWPAPSDAELDAAAAAGVAAWSPGLWSSAREAQQALRWARLAWQREAQLRQQLDERRWVDRAKGILTQARGFSEDEAFRLLRGAAMHAQLKIGEVSRAVVEASLWADAVNRAGQLRMLSQRLVKLAAQRLAGLEAARTRQLHDDSVLRAQEALDHLMAWPASAGPRGDVEGLLSEVQQAWRALRTTLGPARLSPTELLRADQQAEQLLDLAEALVARLQAASHRQPLRVVNLCGRQRMLAQRLAKNALLAELAPGSHHAPQMAACADEFEAALAELEQAPLSNQEIRQSLHSARNDWRTLLASSRALRSPDQALALSRSSEALLQTFDALTSQYEHSMQMLMS